LVRVPSAFWYMTDTLISPWTSASWPQFRALNSLFRMRCACCSSMSTGIGWGVPHGSAPAATFLRMTSMRLHMSWSWARAVEDVNGYLCPAVVRGIVTVPGSR